MEFTRIRVLEATFALLRKALSNVLEYNESHSDFPMEDDHIKRYMRHYTLHALCWGIGGSMKLRLRNDFGRCIA
jgi:dynein heavy chain 1